MGAIHFLILGSLVYLNLLKCYQTPLTTSSSSWSLIVQDMFQQDVKIRLKIINLFANFKPNKAKHSDVKSFAFATDVCGVCVGHDT
ncbi:hypothetical protein ALON55S_08212 [Alishewanella longhuensis]